MSRENYSFWALKVLVASFAINEKELGRINRLSYQFPGKEYKS